MPIYEWICRECSIYWDRELALGKAPDRTRCPKCNKLSSRYWQQQGVAVSFKDDGTGNKGSNAGDFHTVKRRYQKHAEMGWDEKSSKTWLRKAARETKERTDSTEGKYKAMNIKWDKLAKDQGRKKLSDKETAQKVERAKKLTEQAYNNATNMGYKDIGETHLDITKPQKQQ